MNDSSKKLNIGTLLLCLFVPLFVGATSAFLSAEGMSMYELMNMPPLSPPGWVFSVAWTILYICMGLASYFVMEAETDLKCKTFALSLYAAQLFMNFMWSLIFFKFDMYLFAFIWLMIMWVLVIVCTYKFYKICKKTICLMTPYVLWLTFAAYLNFGAYIMNK